jgi:hypothetical protein
MSVALTLAGEALIARLQAEGAALTIDRFIFANVPEQDHTAPVDPAQTVPVDHVVYQYDIPQEYRAFVSPNQVVYSALLGSDVGPFTFNWQGLFCSQHNTLVAVATFPALEKRNTNPATNTQGNNLTRNFMLEFTGVRELTQITVEAAVWQLDFTVRLKGIDTRERLSNRDIYGRACFFADGWLLKKSAGTYSLLAGVAYVEGIRTELAEHTPVQPESTPCDVYLDVCMAPQGSDVVTKTEPQFVAVDAPCPDYVEPAPHHTPHYCVHIARIESDGSVTDKRPKNEEQRFVTPEELAEQLKSISSMPVGTLLFSTTGTPLPGTVPVNVKQKFALEVYPQLTAWVRSCGGYLATEAEWDAEAAAQEGSCGKYCLTDTHIILPCYRHYFSAAQNGAAGKAAGDWAGDAIRNITGELKSSTSPNALLPSLRDTAAASGAFLVHQEDLAGRVENIVQNVYVGADRVIFDASRVVPTAEENRPKTSYLLPCIKAFDVAVNTAQVDMQALAAQVSAINGNKVDRSEWTQSLGESGWQRLPSGLILQWGTGSVSTGVATEVTLPIAYPNAHLSCVAVIGIDYGSVGNDAIAVYNRMAGKFTLKGEHSGSTVMPYSYISIGY